MRRWAIMLPVVIGCAGNAAGPPVAHGPTSPVPVPPSAANEIPECAEALLPSKQRRASARAFFKRGMRSLEVGEFADGIDALKHAYCVLPHRNVLFNIARAYAEWGDLPQAIRWYRAYLAENPPDAEEVQAAVDSLERLVEKRRELRGY